MHIVFTRRHIFALSQVVLVVLDQCLACDWPVESGQIGNLAGEVGRITESALVDMSDMRCAKN